MRPPLTKNIHLDEFKQYYWLKKELQAFCKQHGLSPTGSKEELTERIDEFLRTGTIIKPNRTLSRQNDKNIELSLDTVINENHRCSQEVRAFFKSIIGPTFHFSTYIQKFFKENIGKTYREAVEAWYEEEERKKDPSYQTKIGSQFQYNQFFRDYFSDPANKGRKRQDAIDAWNQIKKQPGSNKYVRS
ncbi:DUF6434 domain-containing protein [Metabacillus niabensis]|uniref:DUF6434 domain-containing protein n=1 Tax=Metabacillus niabensis TaxID=324854 RepID=UPI0039A103F5